jgi:hypothetical protein
MEGIRICQGIDQMYYSIYGEDNMMVDVYKRHNFQKAAPDKNFKHPLYSPTSTYGFPTYEFLNL